MTQDLAGPPRLARWVLRRVLDGPARSAIVGDLDEEFTRFVVPRLGARAARRWDWRQTIASTVACLREPAASDSGTSRTHLGGEIAHAGPPWTRNGPSRRDAILLAAPAPLADGGPDPRGRRRRQHRGLLRPERHVLQAAADCQRRPLRVHRPRRTAARSPIPNTWPLRDLPGTPVADRRRPHLDDARHEHG